MLRTSHSSSIKYFRKFSFYYYHFFYIFIMDRFQYFFYFLIIFSALDMKDTLCRSRKKFFRIKIFRDLFF